MPEPKLITLPVVALDKMVTTQQSNGKPKQVAWTVLWAMALPGVRESIKLRTCVRLPTQTTAQNIATIEVLSPKGCWYEMYALEGDILRYHTDHKELENGLLERLALVLLEPEQTSEPAGVRLDVNRKPIEDK